MSSQNSSERLAKVLDALTPEPLRIIMTKNSTKFPFLRERQVYIVPKSRGMDLINMDEAELAYDIDVLTTENIVGENQFNPMRRGNFKKPDDESKEGKQERKKTSLFLDETCMYEQVKTGGKFFFLKYEFATGAITEHTCVEGSEPLYPIDDEEAVRDFIKLPSNICEYGTEENLIANITKHIYKYLDVPEDYVRMAVLNIMKSWVFQRYHSINYLRVRGEPGTGKSRFLDTVGHLHYKVISTSGATTVAPIFRLINKWQGSLSIDEADLAQGDETNDMIKIINQGFEKDKPVMRCNPEDKSVIDFFDVYCPKILSTRRAFKDLATETRCLTHIMTGTVRKDIPSSLNETYAKDTMELRNMLLLWRFRKYRSIDPDVGESLNWDGIEPRLKQVNVGFVSLFADDKEYLAKFMDYVRSTQKELRQERSMTPEGMIMQGILDLLCNGDLLTANSIISQGKLTDDRGTQWKPQKLAPYMKTLGFLPAKKKRIGDSFEKVYYPDGEMLHNLFVKFIPNEDLLESYEILENQGRLILSNLQHTYHSLFVALFPCVTCLRGTKEAEEQTVVPQLVKNVGHTYKTGHTEEQGNKFLDKLVQNGDLVETRPGTFQLVK